MAVSPKIISARTMGQANWTIAAPLLETVLNAGASAWSTRRPAPKVHRRKRSNGWHLET
jgi:hypothetical protein